ncbi:MAG: hypothetical protein N2645_17350 [Clostridia bacterium]|nr:hypothetical protein [Clostridia bacterium]
MKKTMIFISLFLIALAMTSIFIIKNTSYSTNDISENPEFSRKLAQLIESKKPGERINMKDICDFDWDTLYIYFPYSNPEKASKKEYTWNKSIKTTIETSDGINLLVFTLNKKVVAYINFPRDKGDFVNSIEKLKNGNREFFLPEETVFEIKRENNWTSLEWVK